MNSNFSFVKLGLVIQNIMFQIPRLQSQVGTHPHFSHPACIKAAFYPLKYISKKKRMSKRTIRSTKYHPEFLEIKLTLSSQRAFWSPDTFKSLINNWDFLVIKCLSFSKVSFF